jgi:hypothetical protein
MTRLQTVMRRAVFTLAVVGLVTGVAAGAAAQEEKGPNTGRVSLSAGMDWTTHYFFRGILQEDQDLILQPYAEVGFKLMEGTPAFGDVALAIGLWNSLHGGPTGTGGPNSDPRVWYETDFYTRLGWTFLDTFKAGVIYTAYMSPNSFFNTVEELAFSLGFDDSKLLGPFSVQPTVLLAWEVAGQADGGLHRGIYLQVGVTPSYTVAEKSQYPVTLSLPLLVGLSLDDYYEFGTGDDDTFGYFQGGLSASVPLAFIPAAYGSWSLRGALTVLVLGDNLKAVNNNDSTEVIGTLGVSFTY